MKARNSRRPLTAAIASVFFAATTTPAVAGPVVNTGAGPSTGPDGHVVLDTSATSARYFVQFSEAPLTLYDGTDPQFAAIPRISKANGHRKLDAHSPQAQQYVAHLATMQAQHLGTIAGKLGRSVKSLRTLRHALNAAVVEMTPTEARQVNGLAGIVSVHPVGSHVLATDLGPQFIGATQLWQVPAGVSDDIFPANFDGNTPAAKSNAALGDGIVVGDIDTGYNSLSPSFAPTDDTGYTIQNPLGAGNYLGQCSVANISNAGCNNKVIGVYDEIDDGVTAPYSVEDTQGHGSHTASTAAGDSRSAALNGYTAHISGMAPHANLVIFYGCAPAPKNCPDDALAQAADDAVAGGVVDVINFSISGGFDPWNEPTSQAFLGAEAAGIFIAAAGGNTSASTPAAIPGTVNHFEPWVTTVAAANHNGGPIGPVLSATGPGTPPSNTQNIGLAEAQGDTPLAATIAGTTAFKLSPQFHNTDTNGTDGCSAYPANTFQNAVALVSRGTCSIVTKVANANAAGALAVIISDNRPEAPVTFGMTPTQPIAAFSVTQSDGTHLANFLSANVGGTVTIPNTATRQAAQPDQLADFSLLGPAAIDVIKPEVQAPGTNILAAVSNDGTANGPNLVALFNGTSMATPHTTGAGALLSAVHPDWTPMEIKSALMMTAKEANLTKPNGITASDFFDRGSGRIAVDLASKAGLVLDESATRMQGVNPALGGDGPETLNIASLQNSRCSSTTANTCAFTRTFRSTVNHAVTWTASYTGDPTLQVAVSPSSFSFTGPGIKTVTFIADASGVPSDGAFRFSEVTLTPDDASLPNLHLPAAIAVLPPAIAVTPASLAFSIPSGSSTQDQTLTVANVGGPTLNVTSTNYIDPTPQYAYVTIDQSDLSSSGVMSDLFTDFASGQYVSDDFTVADPATDLALIRVPGFMTVPTSLASLVGQPVHFRIYRDAAGIPNGAPEKPQSDPNNPPTWQFDRSIGQSGLNVTGDTITLDLTAAGAPPTNLAPGTYWVTVYPELSYSGLGGGGWAAVLANSGSGNPAQMVAPTSGIPNWVSISSHYGTPLSDMAMHVEQKVACGAPWLSATPGSLSLGGLSNAPLTVSVDSSNFDGGVTSEVGYLCIQSTDAGKPTAVVRITATQN
jgi:hypothetical protein